MLSKATAFYIYIYEHNTPDPDQEGGPEDGVSYSLQGGHYSNHNGTVHGRQTDKVLIFPAGSEFFFNELGMYSVTVIPGGEAYNVAELLDGNRTGPKRAWGLHKGGVLLDLIGYHEAQNFNDWKRILDDE